MLTTQIKVLLRVSLERRTYLKSYVFSDFWLKEKTELLVCNSLEEDRKFMLQLLLPIYYI